VGDPSRSEDEDPDELLRTVRHDVRNRETAYRLAEQLLRTRPLSPERRRELEERMIAQKAEYEKLCSYYRSLRRKFSK
jgi:signal transduction histidine kinase